MVLPKEFIARCRELYPRDTDLHRALEGGNMLFAGTFLQEAAGGLSASEVLSMLDCDHVEQLREKAVLIVQREQLYEEFCELTDRSARRIKPERLFQGDGISIDELNLGMRARNALARHRKSTIEALICCSEFELLALPDVGKATVAELKEALAARGLKLLPSGREIGESDGDFRARVLRTAPEGWND